MNSSATNDYDFHQLYECFSRHFNHLIAIGLNQGFELQEVKDVIHQLFLEFAEKRIDIADLTNPGSYIITAFRHKLVDHSRINKKRAAILVSLSSGAGVERSIQQEIENAEEMAALTGRLKMVYDRMPKRCRKVIFLKYYEGLSNEEIAARTGLSIRSVYNNLFEGIKLLRADLAPLLAREIGIILIICGYLGFSC